jgi:hypothetical protein
MNKLMVFALLGLLLGPLPWAIALNHQTKQCAGYWGGDEWAHYDLPSGWNAYYLDSHNVVQTEVGSCQLSFSDLKLSIKNCCKELGYAFVSDNIGAQTGLPAPVNILSVIVVYFLFPFLPILVVLGVAAGVLVLLVRSRRVEPPHVGILGEEDQRRPGPEQIRAWGKTVRRCSKCSALNMMSLSTCRDCSADLSSAPTVDNPFL